MCQSQPAKSGKVKEMDTASEFDKKVFLDRVQFLIEHRCQGSKKKFNQIANQRGAEYRWKTANFYPRIEPLLRICNHFGVSMDWLLGRSDQNSIIDDSIPDEESKSNMEIINHYKEIANHWRNLYKHVSALLGEIKAPFQEGVVEKSI